MIRNCRIWSRSPRSVRRKLDKYLAISGLDPSISPHTLRHTFATLTIRKLESSTVQALLGHSRITTTERYLHARPMNELAEQMDAIFGTDAPLTMEPSEEAV